MTTAFHRNPDTTVSSPHVGEDIPDADRQLLLRETLGFLASQFVTDGPDDAGTKATVISAAELDRPAPRQPPSSTDNLFEEPT